MSEKINGQSAFIPGTAQTVDPDESPDRVDKGYTGVDPVYQNAATRAYAPQGSLKLVPEARAFGTTDQDVSDEQKKADEASAEAAKLQAEAAAKAEADAKEAQEKAAAEAKARVEAAPAPTPVTTAPSAPTAPSADDADKK